MHLDLHATDEELARVAKAERRRDRITNSALVGVLLLLTAGIGYWLYGQHVRAVRLDTQGQRIAGMLDDNYTKVMRTKTGEVRYDVTYSFVVAGGTYHGSGAIVNRPRSDQAVIIYDPVDPTNNKIEGAEPFRSTWPESLALLIFVYLCSAISWLYRKFKRRRRRPGNAI
jgi:hypothetical protein